MRVSGPKIVMPGTGSEDLYTDLIITELERPRQSVTVRLILYVTPTLVRADEGSVIVDVV